MCFIKIAKKKKNTARCLGRCFGKKYVNNFNYFTQKIICEAYKYLNEHIYALIQKYLLINYFMCLAITRDNAVTNKSFSFMNLIFYSDVGIEKTNKQTKTYV